MSGKRTDEGRVEEIIIFEVFKKLENDDFFFCDL